MNKILNFALLIILSLMSASLIYKGNQYFIFVGRGISINFWNYSLLY